MVLMLGDAVLPEERVEPALSAKEFSVLEALLRSEAVLSAEELLEQVWDEHVDPFTNRVVVTISRLRRKLGPPRVLDTVPGFGYRLVALAGEPGPGPNLGRGQAAGR